MEQETSNSWGGGGLRQLVRMLNTENKFSFESVILPLGPFPVEDPLEMKAAVTILDRSLDPGDHGKYIQ